MRIDEVVRILIVEDLPTDAELAQREIRQTVAHCLFHQVETRETYLAALETFQPDLIISDYRLPHFDGLTALKLALEQTPLTPVIILTGAMNEDTAVECMKAGAADYVIKEHIKRLGQAVRQALAKKQLRQKRWRAEEALRESEARYRTLVHTLPDTITVTDVAGNITYASPSTLSFYGYTATDRLIGHNILNWVHVSYHGQALEQMKIVLAGGQVANQEYLLLKQDGTPFFGEISASCLKNGSGQAAGIIIVVRDISQRKQAEADQAQLEEQFRQAQKMESIGQLAGGIAHDFNNLLVPIIGYAELGMLNLSAGHKLYANLERIKEAAQRAATLTKQILAFSRQQVLEISTFDLNETIAEFQEMLRRLIGEDIALHITPASSPCQVKADRAQIEQIVLNLSVNARDAMPGGGKLLIETDQLWLDDAYTRNHLETEPGPYIMLAISDTGHGIDADTQKRIFEPFFTTKGQNKGTGLGLAMVFGIVKQHQGHIQVYSELGKGTTFKIYLPQAEQTVQAGAEAGAESASASGTETILVVEDDPMVRKLTCDILQAHGYTVFEADDPATGLQWATGYDQSIHLLLTDVVMPLMNGRELHDQLTITRPELKVLYMSGYTDDVIVHHGVLDEDVHFLQKPFTVSGLTQKVRTVLGSL